MSWKLKRTRQCEKCPWRVDVDPHDIPNEYSVEKHRALKATIAQNFDMDDYRQALRVMACHETDDAHCIGWLHHQLGRGNNIRLRVQMITCTNANKIKVIGEQHKRFEDTLPTN